MNFSQLSFGKAIPHQPVTVRQIGQSPFGQLPEMMVQIGQSPIIQFQSNHNQLVNKKNAAIQTHPNQLQVAAELLVKHPTYNHYLQTLI